MDISNGRGIGIALFVQGCHFKCQNCFNSETWDFNQGREWTNKSKEKFISLITPYTQRVSILGGEPLALENLDGVLDLLRTIRCDFPDIIIWLYTGYNWEVIQDNAWCYHPKTEEKLSLGRFRRKQIIGLCNIVVDGQFIERYKDLKYPYAGSTNQRIIDVARSLEAEKVVLWNS